ncbi:BolA family transcriptional regulator [Solemya pervernicosa gill symbiont]|uniref:BolA family transcriptional regulator n=2 Tax=Gammaproteobacteria incertae sedis TaxID=118884 RepID=A0A1T2L669_9GAMM|nr:BolA family protein [Candidatus Reidiella endopervernicosa]OOZ40597.1 BolA family transcriptional regulator [Solemya pervernicosa gill symbiont]QKQ26609.1 BolA family transcriptional regulator [Candidatus Reidiella endopervernicosa]
MSTDRITMIRERLDAALSPTQIDIIDESAKHAGHAGAKGGGGHFIVTLISGNFSGKSLIERHRMVYDALGDAMQSEIHALSINAKAPEEI